MLKLAAVYELGSEAAREALTGTLLLLGDVVITSSLVVEEEGLRGQHESLGALRQACQVDAQHAGQGLEAGVHLTTVEILHLCPPGSGEHISLCTAGYHSVLTEGAGNVSIDLHSRTVARGSRETPDALTLGDGIQVTQGLELRILRGEDCRLSALAVTGGQLIRTEGDGARCIHIHLVANAPDGLSVALRHSQTGSNRSVALEGGTLCGSLGYLATGHQVV